MIKYVSINNIVENDKYPFTKGQIQHFITKRKDNGLSSSVRKIGRRIYIREDLFDEWIESHLEDDIKQETKELNTSNRLPMSLELLKTEEMEFSIRTLNCLKSLNIKNAEELSKLTKTKLKKIKNMGKRSIDEVEDKLVQLGIILGD